MKNGGSKSDWNSFFTHDEREMLIRYCIHFTHDKSLAEDLTQQALLESWLKFNQLYTQEVRSSWLIGIARNVCLRWLRCHSQERAHIARMSELPIEVETSCQNNTDLEEEWERQELTQLVEKALALLSPQNRAVLVPYYLEAVPQAKVADRLGITVGAVEARLQRGKRALRHLLTHDLREEAASFGLITSGIADWQDTHIWCPRCGERQLLIRHPEPPGILSFRCPGCSDDPQEFGWGYALSNTAFVQRLSGVTQPKAILRRFISWAYEYYSTAASNNGIVACAQCEQKIRLHLTLPSHLSHYRHHPTERYGWSGQCPSCGWQDYCSPSGFLQSLPAVQHFWLLHPRMRLIFREPISEAAGQPAWIASFESVSSADCLDVVLAQQTLIPIDIHSRSL